MKMRAKILLMALLPLVLLGGGIALFSGARIDTVVSDNIINGLRGTALSVRDTLNYADDGVFSVNGDGDLVKGGFNVTQNEVIADNVKNATGMEVTVFFGDTRYMTSICGEDGQRVLGTSASGKVVEAVLKNGEDFSAENVDVVGTPFYAYYAPLYDNSGTEPVGMVFAGISQEEAQKEIGRITGLTGAVTLGVTFGCAVILLFAVSGMVRALHRGVKAVGEVAAGNLAFEMDRRILRRRDEIGGIGRAIDKLKSELVTVMKSVKEQSGYLITSADFTSGKTRGAAQNIEQIESAVEDIARSATTQADETQKATQNIILMGNLVEETGEEVERLSENAREMKQLGSAAFHTLQELNEINEKARVSIETIYRQTHTTNESAQKIREAVLLITNIARETNLLSLNASIEAARAGEQGRGFAVVASQIQKLAEQSNASAKQIEDIVDSLIADSATAVETMHSVKEIMDRQSGNVKDTDGKFRQVMDGIELSLKGVAAISEKSGRLDSSRGAIVETVQNLTAIAEENAAGTEETSASVTEMRDMIMEIAENADKLKSVADKIEENISVFRTEESG